jgi:hypothetical protein
MVQVMCPSLALITRLAHPVPEMQDNTTVYSKTQCSTAVNATVTLNCSPRWYQFMRSILPITLEALMHATLMQATLMHACHPNKHGNCECKTKLSF